MAGPYRYAMDQQLAQLLDDARGVVLGASRAAGVDENDIVRLQSGLDSVADARSIVGRNWQSGRFATPLAHLPGEEHGIEIDDCSRLDRPLAGFDQLRASGQDGHCR